MRNMCNCAVSSAIDSISSTIIARCNVIDSRESVSIRTPIEYYEPQHINQSKYLISQATTSSLFHYYVNIYDATSSANENNNKSFSFYRSAARHVSATIFILSCLIFLPVPRRLFLLLSSSSSSSSSVAVG